jgi:hypothetical protein
MKKVILLALSSSVILFTNCSRSVTRISPTEQIDISGRWNNTDSRFVSEEMTSAILSADWLNNHAQAKGAKPVVIVGFVSNKSHEHIEAETFVKDVEQINKQTLLPAA